MAIQLFTPEEIKELEQHPAVQKVNEHFLHLTPEFKEWFYREFQAGKSARIILLEAGFNMDIIKTRVRSIRAHILKWKSEQPKTQSKFSSEPLRASVSELCRIANVSRSGYYRWAAAAECRARREAQDQNDFALILRAYNHRGYAKGARSIYMRLLHLETPVCMNLKKIRRIMNKYGLKCPIRRANPYRRMLNAMRTSHVAPNLLQREFREHGPRKVLLTDITYLTYGSGQRAYMVTILDAYTKQLLAYEVSQSLKIGFVLNAVNRLIKIHGVSLQAETLINSDQGSHYTSLKFIQIIRDNHLRQSMSRKANCWDNGPQESFFGHMKDELDLASCSDYNDLLARIDDWADYYNNDRYQWNLALLSPNEYARYLESGVYPLKRSTPTDPFVKPSQDPE